jgi:uncharacterized protein (DUF1499 family)
MAAAAPIIALVAAGLALVGVLFAWLGVVTPLVGFQTFAAGALLGGLFATVVSLIGLFLSRGGKDPAGFQKSLMGLALALGLLIVVLGAAATGGDAPPINDITTDLDSPPAFADAALVPEYADRDMSYPAEFVEIVRESYPDLASLSVPDAPADALLRAERAAESLGWEVIAKDGSRGTLYARDETALFRFVDDVVVRVTPTDDGSLIDVRSKSRDGRGDLGANAARIRALLEALQ